jgi:uncharacterized protein
VSDRPEARVARGVGHGIGLRAGHYAVLLERGAPVEWAEMITENVLRRGGRPLAVLERVRRDAGVTLHGVSLSIGGMDPLDREYLIAVRELARHIEAGWVSDHLCFGTSGGHYAHDLWPLPYTEEAIAHVVSRVREAQDILGDRLLLENVSSYVRYRDSEMSEHEFLVEIVERADAGILLDVNNVHVSAMNHGFSAKEYIDAIPPGRVGQIHLAGHLDRKTHLLDNHGSEVPDPVWDLYRHTVQRLGRIPTIIERDEDLPSLPDLLAESEKARSVEREALAEIAP